MRFFLWQVATTAEAGSVHILRLKCAKYYFAWGRDFAVGAYSAPPDLLAGFKWA